ncbi:MAG: hypothetical protein RLZZ501_2135 [Pseudomonadota bacterium]|jgi:hypothetical protein
MRKFIIGVGLLLAVIAGGLFYLFSSLDGIVKTVIERVGSDVAGTKVSVGGVALRLAEGKATLSGLTVANPPGFSSEPAIRLGEVTIALDTTSLNHSPIVIKEVSVAAPAVALELGAGGSNLAVLRRNVTGATAGRDEAAPAEAAVTQAEPAQAEVAQTEPAQTEVAKTEPAQAEAAKTEAAKPEAAQTEAAQTEAAKPEPAQAEPAKTEPAKTEPAKAEAAKPAEKTVVIRHLAIAQGRVSLAVTGLPGASTTAKLDDIVLNDLGEKSGGATGAEIGRAVLDAVLSAALKSSISLNASQGGAVLDAVKQALPEQAGEALKALGR